MHDRHGMTELWLKLATNRPVNAIIIAQLILLRHNLSASNSSVQVITVHIFRSTVTHFSGFFEPGFGFKSFFDFGLALVGPFATPFKTVKNRNQKNERVANLIIHCNINSLILIPHRLRGCRFFSEVENAV